jgi:hypothetical protein
VLIRSWSLAVHLLEKLCFHTPGRRRNDYFERILVSRAIIGIESTAAMIASAIHSRLCLGHRLFSWLRAATSLILLSWLGTGSPADAQFTPGTLRNSNGPSSVKGTVLNRTTHQPISRALVFSTDQQYAVLTDDRGHFEFKFPPPELKPAQDPSSATDPEALRARQLRSFRNSQFHVFQARKPGFLQDTRNPSYGRATADQSELTISLDPESLIVGHVQPQTSEVDLRFHLELFRREFNNGQEHWNPAGGFTTWADGEFRFSNLAAGTYKLVTHEQIDRDPFTFTPGSQLFGYTPTFYQDTSDFSSATAIQLAAGETFQANISPVRREYYPIKVPVADSSGVQQITVRVYPLGHAGPGYSLGFNTAEQQIEGMLPNGDYTLQAETQGQPGSTGIQNFSVHGAPLQGSALTLIPNQSVTVNVREEFKSGRTVFDDARPEPQPGSSFTAPFRQAHVWVMLNPIEEFGSTEGGASRPMENSEQHALVIPNIRPGRYRVHVESAVGFPAFIQSGGTDLLQEPLVVSLGGSNSPIELTLRDDGAEITGESEEATATDRSSLPNPDNLPRCHVYFLPIPGSTSQFREAVAGPDGSFMQQQLPPGSYRVLAFATRQEDLASRNQEALRTFDSMAQFIHVVPGQKEHLRVKIIPDSDAP